MSRLSVENFFSHSAKNYRRGTLLRFRKLRVSKTVRDKTGGGIHDSPSKVFRHPVTKHFVEKLLCAVFQKIFGSEKVYGQKGRGRGCEYEDFASKNFRPTVPKKFVAESFSVSIIPGIEQN